MGIIGVIAAMTLPTLVQKYEDKVTVTKVKKAYSIFSQAYARAIEANGGLPKEEWDCSHIEQTSNGAQAARCYMTYLLPYISSVRKCESNGGRECSFSTMKNDTLYYSLNGDSIGRLSDGGGAYTIGADGIEFMVYRMFLVVKTDRKPKNVLNKNIFLFGLREDRLAYSICKATKIDHYLQGYTYPSCFVSATDWILLHGNLDYMRCPDKVGINGPYSCK